MYKSFYTPGKRAYVEGSTRTKMTRTTTGRSRRPSLAGCLGILPIVILALVLNLRRRLVILRPLLAHKTKGLINPVRLPVVFNEILCFVCWMED